MIERRQLLTVGGLLGALAPASAEGAAIGAGQSLSSQAVQDIVSAIKDVRAAIAADHSFDDIRPVRDKQLDYLKAQGKFPDFIDVSADVWFAVHDWHIRLLQPLTLGRDATGRYTLMLGFTTLVLRQDFTPRFIGTPYDSR
jgi:hypothetical protein